MTNKELKAIEERLKLQNYQVIERGLACVAPKDLLILIDGKSRKIADTAATLLDRQKEMELLIKALITDSIRTAPGRIRATNVLNWHGRAVPQAVEAHLHLLGDRSDDVLSNALFGIVFMRRRDLLPKLRKYLEEARPDSARHKLFREAIGALEADRPSLFSPGFHDANNVWRLNEQA